MSSVYPPGFEWLIFAVDGEGNITDRAGVRFGERARDAAEAVQSRIEAKGGTVAAILLIVPSAHPDDVLQRLRAALALKTPEKIVKLLDPEDRPNWDGTPSAEAVRRSMMIRAAASMDGEGLQPPTL